MLAVFESYAQYEYLLASTQLFLAMLGMGALLAPADFLLEIRKPKGLIVGLLMQWLLLPLVALVLGYLLVGFGVVIPSGIVLGFLLISTVPTGTLGNILTFFGKGNVALSISLTAITTVCALLTTPVLLHLLLANYLPDDFQMPTTQIAQDIFFALIIPLMIGMWIKSKSNVSFSDTFSRWSVRLSLVLIVLMAVSANNSGRIDPKAYGVMGIAALFIFCAALQLMAFLLAKFNRLSSRDILAIVIKSSFRNISLAVAIKAIIFPAQAGIIDPVADAVFFTVLLYGGVSLFMSLLAMFYHRYTAS
jgi:BASS family bile acid:Na+ symporter